MNPTLKRLVPIVVVVAVAAAGVSAYVALRKNGPGEGFSSGNGRIEATEVDVATKLPGRLEDMFVADGDFVKAGQLLARMQVESLQAQRDEARAHRQQALQGVASAEAQVALRESDRAAVDALVVQRESDLDAAQRRLERSEMLAAAGSLTQQQLDDDRARVRSDEAALRRPGPRSTPRRRPSPPRARRSPGRAQRCVQPRRPSPASTSTSRTASSGRRATAGCSTALPSRARWSAAAARCSTWST